MACDTSRSFLGSFHWLLGADFLSQLVIFKIEMSDVGEENKIKSQTPKQVKECMFFFG